MTDLLVAAHNYVISDPGIQQLVLEGVIGSDDLWYDGWIFRAMNDGVPQVDPESSGKCSVVLYTYSSWASQNMHNSSKFPRLQVSIYADPTRNEDGAPVAYDAETKIDRVWREIDRLFHDSANKVHWFGDLYIVSTLEGIGLSKVNIPNGDNSVRGDVAYDLVLI